MCGETRIKKCSVEGCERKHKTKGYCSMHYQRHYRGSPLSGRPPKPAMCSVEGCERKHKAKGYCNTHYQRQRQNILLSGRPPKPAMCSVEGCERYRLAKGYCNTHYHTIDRNKKKACKIIYKHSKDFENDPEALTDDFIQDLIGLKCERLEGKSRK